MLKRLVYEPNAVDNMDCIRSYSFQYIDDVLLGKEYSSFEFSQGLKVTDVCKIWI